MSVALTELWLPILLGGLFCWIASALIHMVIKYHNADYTPLANEDQVSEALRAGDPKPALYSLPHCKDMKDMGDEAMQQKFARGPVALISVFPNGMPPMGKLLIQQFLHFVIAAVLVAYIATLSLPVGSDYMTVFRLVFVTTLAAHGLGNIPYSIWFGHPWSNCIRFLIDALIYAAVTAGTFAWLWPVAG